MICKSSIKYFIISSSLPKTEIMILSYSIFFNSKVIKDLEEFKKVSDVIVANRLNENLKDVENKVYTRDIFKCDD